MPPASSSRIPVSALLLLTYPAPRKTPNFSTFAPLASPQKSDSSALASLTKTKTADSSPFVPLTRPQKSDFSALASLTKTKTADFSTFAPLTSPQKSDFSALASLTKTKMADFSTCATPAQRKTLNISPAVSATRRTKMPQASGIFPSTISLDRTSYKQIPSSPFLAQQKASLPPCKHWTALRIRP